MIDVVVMFVSRFRQHDDEEEAQAMVEYALLLVLIAVVSVTALKTLGKEVSAVCEKISTDLIPVS